jgi:hypothetical protein
MKKKFEKKIQILIQFEKKINLKKKLYIFFYEIVLKNDIKIRFLNNFKP